MTHPARASMVSAVADALRAAGLSGVFLIRETSPGVIEVEHNARRESTLHVRTDLFEAGQALARAGFEPFELGTSIIARKVATADSRPPLAKARSLGEGAPQVDDEGGEGDGGASGEEAYPGDEKPRVA